MSAQGKVFAVNDRVLILPAGGWKQLALGQIVGPPEAVETLQGHDVVYWVAFAELQEDINGPDKYSKAQILSCYLKLAI